MTQELENSLRSKDLNGIKAALIGYLDIENQDDVMPIIAELDGQLKLQDINLFEPDDGRFDLSSGTASQDALRSIKAALRLNFSREKLCRGAEFKKQLMFRGSTEKAEAKNKMAEYVTCAKNDNSAMQKSHCVSRIPTSFNDFALKNETKLPEELRQALERGEVSAVKSILMGFLDVFDKTEAIPVIEYAALCKDSFEKKGITLFDVDDKSLDFSTLPLSAGTLRTLKAKLRLNFSLEKMIFAEKIFQQELAEKIKNSKPQPEGIPPRQPISGQQSADKLHPETVIKPQQPIAAQQGVGKSQPETVIKPQQPIAAQQGVGKSQKTIAGQTGTDRQQQSQSSYTTKEPLHSTSRPQTTSSSPQSNDSQQNTRKPETIRVEIIYEPGPLERFFGDIGKFFDGLFNNQGRKIERPYHKR